MYTAYANKEVILSAGVFATPHLLMLSGIGPKEELQKFNVRLIYYAYIFPGKRTSLGRSVTLIEQLFRL